MSTVLHNITTNRTFQSMSSDPGVLVPVLTASGDIADLKMAETVAAGDLLYYKEADEEFAKADADAIATMPVVAMALEAGSNGAYSKALIQGYVKGTFLRDLNAATGTITLSGNVGDGDYFTIGGVKFSFETTGDAPAGAVKIDASASVAKTAMQPALLAALQANATTSARFTFSAWGTDVLTLTAKHPTYSGAAGNALTLAHSGTNLAVSGATLTGGNDGGPAYASGTAGAITFTKPAGVDDVAQIIGWGVQHDELLFNPQPVTAAQAWNRLMPDAATVTIDETYDGKIVVMDKTDGCTINLPAAASVLGMQVSFVVMDTLSTPATINAVIASDDIMGGLIIGNDTNDTIVRWTAGATDNKITLGATTGGLVGSKLTLTAVKAGEWYAEGTLDASGTEATPFSAAS